MHLHHLCAMHVSPSSRPYFSAARPLSTSIGYVLALCEAYPTRSLLSSPSAANELGVDSKRIAGEKNQREISYAKHNFSCTLKLQYGPVSRSNRDHEAFQRNFLRASARKPLSSRLSTGPEART